MKKHTGKVERQAATPANSRPPTKRPESEVSKIRKAQKIPSIGGLTVDATNPMHYL